MAGHPSGILIAHDARIAGPRCRVAGVIGTETGFEFLPPDAWNGKFLMGENVERLREAYR